MGVPVSINLVLALNCLIARYIFVFGFLICCDSSMIIFSKVKSDIIPKSLKTVPYVVIITLFSIACVNSLSDP